MSMHTQTNLSCIESPNDSSTDRIPNAYIYGRNPKLNLMLSQTFFSEDDNKQLQRSSRINRLVAYGSLVIFIPVDILIAYVAFWKTPIVFWIFAIFCILMLLWMVNAAFFRQIRKFELDLGEQTKLTGEVLVTSKSKKNKQFIIGLDAEDLDAVPVGKPAFEKIEIGDKLSIEFSKYGKLVFKLTRNGESLLQPSRVRRSPLPG